MHVYGLAGRGRFFCDPVVADRDDFFLPKYAVNLPRKSHNFSFYTHYAALAFPDVSVYYIAALSKLSILFSERVFIKRRLLYCFVLLGKKCADSIIYQPREVTCVDLFPAFCVECNSWLIVRGPLRKYGYVGHKLFRLFYHF